MVSRQAKNTKPSDDLLATAGGHGGGSTEADGDSNLGVREDQLSGAGFWGSDFLICSGGYPLVMSK